ncbi:MAG TPA: hypothetical protein VF585_03675 [Chthoniobacterales bacterium]|jgi:hypothetical protein
MTFGRYFLAIVGAALGSAVLGGMFAAAVAFISPEFVRSWFMTTQNDPIRFAAGLGMIWGLFLGTGVMGFCIAVTTLVTIVKLLKKPQEN